MSTTQFICGGTGLDNPQKGLIKKKILIEGDQKRDYSYRIKEQEFQIEEAGFFKELKILEILSITELNVNNVQQFWLKVGRIKTSIEREALKSVNLV